MELTITCVGVLLLFIVLWLASMSNTSVHGDWRQAEWRIPAGDWRFASSASDAQWQHADGDTSQTMSEYHVTPNNPKDALDVVAMRAILTKAGVGAVHRAAPREHPMPAVGGRHNHLYSFSTTASSFEMPPATRTIAHPMPDMSLAPSSPAHRRLETLQRYIASPDKNPLERFL